MNLIKQTIKILSPQCKDEAIKQIKLVEYAARNCKQSIDKITSDSHNTFIPSLIKAGHLAPLEFASMSVELTTSRAVLTELTRHRLASFCVESQRFVKYDNIDFIIPEWAIDCDKEHDEAFERLCKSLQKIEKTYCKLIKSGLKAQEAREILPNCTACKIVINANLREWLHIFELRTSSAAYPQIKSLINKVKYQASLLYPWVFNE